MLRATTSQTPVFHVLVTEFQVIICIARLCFEIVCTKGGGLCLQLARLAYVTISDRRVSRLTLLAGDRTNALFAMPIAANSHGF